MHRRRRSTIVFKSKALQQREQREQKRRDEELFSFVNGEFSYSLHVFHEKRLEIRHEPIPTSSLQNQSTTSEIGCFYVVSLLMSKLPSMRETTLRELCTAPPSSTAFNFNNYHRQRSSLGKTALVVYKV